MMVNFKKDHTLNQKRKVLCQSCKNVTQHVVMSSIKENGSASMSHYPDDLIFWDTDHEIVKCLGCETLSFRMVSTNSEDCDREGRPTETENIYPKRSKDTWPQKNFWNSPHNIQRIYREAVFCYNSDNLTLCAAGVRALVEGICKDQKIEGGKVVIEEKNKLNEGKFRKNLQGKINGLHENGKLTKSSADTLHEHRFLGNTAIHELSVPSKFDLSLALEIIEDIINSLYELPLKGQRLKRRRLSGPKSN